MKMRRITATLLVLALLLVCLPVQSFAEVAASGTYGENITWELTDDGTLTISGTGIMESDSYFKLPWYSLRDQIKTVVVEEGVTEICTSAFQESGIQSVHLPESMVKIGNSAFRNCLALTQISIPANVAEIGNYAFSGDLGLEKIVVDEENEFFSDHDGVLYDKAQTRLIRCPAGFTGDYVTAPTTLCIDDEAFMNCKKLTGITITDQVTELGGYAFWECTELETAILPESLVEIRESTFSLCSSLQSIQIPKGVTVIGDMAFSSCTSLREVTVSETVTKINMGAFGDCSALESITFAGDAPEFNQYAFGNTTTTAYYPSGNETWTEDVRKDYAGTVQWVSYETETEPEQPDPPKEPEQPEEKPDEPVGQTQAMHRLYNPNSGEHFYTGSTVERDNLTAVGWQYEGVAWNAPTKEGTPVYRLFNPNNGDHHYTMSAEERDNLVAVGWQYEGVAWNSASPSNLPMYRLYNPNADCGSHHYTGSEEERDYLVSLGWHYEGIGWYGMLK